MKRKNYTVELRRKREGKTNYKKRLKLLLASKPRLVVRKSLNNILLQIIDYSHHGDIVKVSSHTHELKKLGWKFSGSSIPGAYLAGLLLAVKAKKKKISECILDMGFNENVPRSKIYAALKGTLDGGLNVPHSKEILPTEERVSGQHIAKFAELVKKNQAKYKNQFSACLKSGADPAQLPKQFAELKSKIMKM